MASKTKVVWESKKRLYCSPREERAKRGTENDGALVLILRCMLMKKLASSDPVLIQGVTVGTELALFSFQPEHKALAHF